MYEASSSARPAETAPTESAARVKPLISAGYQSPCPTAGPPGAERHPRRHASLGRRAAASRNQRDHVHVVLGREDTSGRADGDIRECQERQRHTGRPEPDECTPPGSGAPILPCRRQGRGPPVAPTCELSGQASCIFGTPETANLSRTTANSRAGKPSRTRSGSGMPPCRPEVRPPGRSRSAAGGASRLASIASRSPTGPHRHETPVAAAREDLGRPAWAVGRDDRRTACQRLHQDVAEALPTPRQDE